MAKSLNRVQLIGNLTRDPELRYTEKGTAVCTFGLATNRTVITKPGEKTEEVDYHRIVAWRKLAELCDQYLTKGRKVYVSGRLQTRTFTGQDGTQKTITEVVIDDLILLDRKQEVRLHV
jgi:single-strand DNA-binding protein